MATACFTGLPAFTSVLTFSLNALGVIDLIRGIALSFGFVFRNDAGEFLDRAADLQQDGFVLFGHVLQFCDAGFHLFNRHGFPQSLQPGFRVSPQSCSFNFASNSLLARNKAAAWATA